MPLQNLFPSRMFVSPHSISVGTRRAASSVCFCLANESTRSLFSITYKPPEVPGWRLKFSAKAYWPLPTHLLATIQVPTSFPLLAFTVPGEGYCSKTCPHTSLSLLHHIIPTLELSLCTVLNGKYLCLRFTQFLTLTTNIGLMLTTFRCYLL